MNTETPLDTLSCGRCLNRYNKTDRLPRILIGCGDTLCTACIQHLLGPTNSFECPYDQTKCHMFKRGIETFPTNTALVHLLDRTDRTPAPEKKQQQHQAANICKEHDEEMRLFCIQDKRLICDDCLGQDHKGHFVKSVKKIKTEAVEEKNRLESMLANIEKNHTDWSTEVEQEKSHLTKEVKNKFQELKWLLMKKESEVILEIGNLFDNEKQKAEVNNGLNSNFKTSINDRITQLRDLVQHDDFSKSSHDNTAYNVDQPAIEKQFENFKQTLKDLSSTVNKSLATQLDGISNIGISLGNEVITAKPASPIFEEEIETNITTPSTGTVVETEDYSKILHFFRIETRPIGLLILLRSRNQHSKDTVDFDKLKQETRITLKLGRAGLSDESLRALTLLWKKLGDIVSLRLDHFTDYVSDTQFTSLLPIIFSKSRTLSKVEFNMERCRIGDPSFCMLFEDVLPRIQNLSKLHLNLKSTDITDKSLEVFAANMIPILKKLNLFHFFLSKTKVSDAGVTPIFTYMERLKSFKLSLECTKITDKSIEPLISKTIAPSAVNLEELEVDVGKTKVTDQSIFQLSCEMPRMKNFVLNIGCTTVGDASIEGLATRSLPTMHNLEYFAMYLWETRVSDKSLVRLSCNMEKLTKFKLHVGASNVTDKSMLAISKNMMSSIKALEELEFSVKNTSVSDEGVLAMLGNIEKVKKLSLNVGQSKTKDIWLERFAKEVVPKMEALESVKLYLMSTKVTDHSMVRLWKMLKNLNNLHVYLQETEVSDVCVEEFLNYKGNVMKRNYDELDIGLNGTNVSDKLRSKITNLRRVYNN